MFVLINRGYWKIFDVILLVVIKYLKHHLERTHVVYCDWTASGKQLKCIATYISNQVS